MTADFRPSASIETLRARAELIAAIRQFFDSRDFFEVQTPTLCRDTVVDRHIDPIAVTTALPGHGPQDWYLHTSPEFSMKRLLAAGAEAIYQIGPAYRADEVGQQHNLEFTMLEWYRVGDSYAQGIQLLDQLVQEILKRPAAERLTYRQAFQQFANIDIVEKPRPTEQLNELWVQRIEPALGQFKSVIIYDWPVEQAALAKVRIDATGEQVSERFEIYVDGVELANGYHELTDANVLRQRAKENNLLRVADGRSPLPADSLLLDAMDQGLPDSCGVALGVDRLVMVALGKSSIAEVMSFDSRRA